MNLQIRNASADDIPAIIKLMREFAEYEDLLAHLEVTVEKLADAIFGEDAFVECLIALESETPVAYAIFYPYFASFRGQRGIYLEDIFVTESRRKEGVGEKMLRRIARIGRKQGAVRMDFQVLKSNPSAVRFYKKHGAVIDEDERHFKFTDEAFGHLAA